MVGYLQDILNIPRDAVIGIIVFLVIALVVAVVVPPARRHAILSEELRTYSKRINFIIQLNQAAEFHTVRFDPVYIEFDTKPQYDRALKNPENPVMQNVMSHMLWYQNIIANCRHNKRRKEWYERQLQYIPKTLSPDECVALGIPVRFAEKYEDKWARKELPEEPVTEPDFKYRFCYTSPQGRNSYQMPVVYSFEDIETIYKKVQEIPQARSAAEYERSLMNPGLRYDVMRRDGFRCVLCGRSAEYDGVKLHVDHIVPVSKGGRTEMDNLRTLCESCNLGKSDKYNPNGPN